MPMDQQPPVAYHQPPPYYAGSGPVAPVPGIYPSMPQSTAHATTIVQHGHENPQVLQSHPTALGRRHTIPTENRRREKGCCHKCKGLPIWICVICGLLVLAILAGAAYGIYRAVDYAKELIDDLPDQVKCEEYRVKNKIDRFNKMELAKCYSLTGHDDFKP